MNSHVFDRLKSANVLQREEAFVYIYENLNDKNDTVFVKEMILSLKLDDYLRKSMSIEQSINSIYAANALNQYRKNTYIAYEHSKSAKEESKKSETRIENDRKHKIQLEWTKTIRAIFVPILSIFAVFGCINWVGGRLQETSFRRETVFKSQLKLLYSAEKNITEIEMALTSLYQQINLSNAKNSSSIPIKYDLFIIEKRNELEMIRNDLKKFPEKHRANLEKLLDISLININKYLTHEELNIDVELIKDLRYEISRSVIDFLESSTS